MPFFPKFIVCLKKIIFMKPIIFLAFANDRVDYTRYLRNLPKEQEGIRNALQSAVQQHLCEIVERTNCTLDQIFDIFQDARYKDRIAVFHYGGHANGYKFLLEKSNGENATVHAKGLVDFLTTQKSLQLAFLNGCATQQQSQELAQNGLAVIGTFSEIDDEVAQVLAVRFYKGIAQNLPIEKAWEDAQNQLKAEKGTQNSQLYRDKIGESLPYTLLGNRLSWQLNSQKNYKLANINRFLMNLSEDDFVSFCMFHFEKVHNNFTATQSKQQKVMALIDHCKRFLEMDILLERSQELNAVAFEQFKPYF